MAERIAVPASSIDKLFNARTVAVVGVSADPTKLSSMPISAMLTHNYTGRVIGVNPRYTKLGEHWECVPTIADLPDDVDAAVIVLPAAGAVDASRQLAAKGVRSIVIVAQGFGEAGGEGLKRDEALLDLARNQGVAIAGPNTNGLANVASGLCLSFAPILQFAGRVKPGRISVVSQSGAVVSSILSKTSSRGVGIAKIAVCGNELVLGLSDYLEYVANDPETDHVLLYIETIRDPEGLKRALAACRKNGKRVAALLVGESDSGKAAALSHTGAIAGSFQNTKAFLKREGVAVADEIDTIAALMEFIMRYPTPLGAPMKAGMASISGGYAALTADAMSRYGMPFTQPSPGAQAKLAALPNQSHAVNPYDIAAQNQIIPDIFRIFAEDGYNQMMIGFVPLATPIRKGVLPMLIEARKNLFPQFFCLAPDLPEDEILELQAAGIIVAASMPPLLQAMRALEDLPPPATAPRDPAIVRAKIGALPEGAGLMNESDSKAFIGKLGIRAPKAVVLHGKLDATALAGLSRPVVMKGLSDKIAHKTEYGLVALNLRTDAEISAAWDKISAALAKADPDSTDILVEEMLSGGLEAIVGLQRDPVTGPAVVVGAGGILVELLGDAVVIVPPFSHAEVKAEILRTKLGKLLTGYRGRSYDIDALVEAVVNVGDLALAEPRLDSIDINPVLVQAPGQGVVALDAKITLSA